ncbi:MAG: hypothetical protein E7033_02410 [Akkermansiaceae bacterium]|nr:hypothetical protein [Akkermansiaceae bacterium]
METDTELMYVDTCFLMQAKGREYIAAGKGRCRVIVSVKRELLRLSARNLAAREACLFCEKEPAPVEFAPLLPEERDIEKTLKPGESVSADSVFRRIAIQCESLGKSVRFLTADTALAGVLSLYRGVCVTFFAAQDNSVVDWDTYRRKNINRTQQELLLWMAGKDVVLAASCLTSPHLMQFLRNIKEAGLPHADLPLLHKISQESATENGHLTRLALSWLADASLVRHVSCEAEYGSEAALFDAVYYARTSGRPICILVADWALADRYNAAGRAAEMLPDSVCFCNLNVWGFPVPLHKDWRLLRKEEQLNPSIPLLPPSVAKVDDISTLIPLIQNEHMAEVQAFVGDCPHKLASALLIARRWGKREILRMLMAKVDRLPALCLNAWFKEHKKSPARLSHEALLEDDEYYACLRLVIERTEEVASAQNSIAILIHLARQGIGKSAQRARVLLGELRRRGAAVADKDVAPINIFQPKYVAAIEKNYLERLTSIIKSAKMAEIPALLAEMATVEEFPVLHALAIKIARRQNRPGVVTLLLKNCEALPAYCFEHWFTRSSSYADSPRAHDLLLRKSFFDITKRIISLSPNLQSCRASMQTLRNLSRDTDPTIRSRALELIQFATAKNAPAVK